MIDTVCLLIPRDKLKIEASPYIKVTGWRLHSNTNQYSKFIKNPSKEDLDSGLYFPRLTGYKRKNFKQEDNVKIEFSAPKLLYNNNLDELEDSDFPEVLRVLKKRLEVMGVVVSESTLREASVSSVHFSKNIQILNGYTSSHLISEIGKINLPKSLDFSKTRFVNDGQSLYAHANSHQLVIYDKIVDLLKGKNRAIDKDQTEYQRSLYPDLKKRAGLNEVIRFEIRLNQKQKMNKVLEDLGYLKNPTFSYIFNTKISVAVIKKYWLSIVKEKNLGTFSVQKSLKDKLRILFINNPILKPKQAVYLLGLLALSVDEGGIRQLRSIVTGCAKDRTWYRIAQDLKLANELTSEDHLRDWVIQIDEELKNYKPYKMKNYEEQRKYSMQII